MLKDKVSHTYLINLKKREDRFLSANAVCKLATVPFERFEAVDGALLPAPPISKYHSKYVWSRGALGLVETTINILKDAILNKYDSILILEDDIEFHPYMNKIVDDLWEEIPVDWEMIQLGINHNKPCIKVTNNVDRIVAGDCLHAYIVHNSIYEKYLLALEKREKQIDVVTAEDIQPDGKCYSVRPSVAFQKAGKSNIQERFVNHDYLRINNLS